MKIEFSFAFQPIDAQGSNSMKGDHLRRSLIDVIERFDCKTNWLEFRLANDSF